MTSPLRSVRRLRSALVALTLTAATAGTALAVAAPAAHADAPDCASTVTLTVNGKVADKAVKYDSSVTLTAKVTPCVNGVLTSVVPTAGNLQILRTTDFAHTTKVTGTTFTSSSTSASVQIKGSHKLVPRLAGFVAVYTGATDGSTGAVYSDGDSTPRYVGVFRSLKRVSKKSLRNAVKATYQAKPIASIKGLKAQIQRKKNGKWRTIKKIKVDSHGKFTYTFPKGVTRALLPDARGFLSSGVKVTVTIRHRRPVARFTTR